ncbi:DUF4249 domain-containing protein [Plebeiibacterium sediminum]|uniref:DUF4249 domain-containing protein n=1 Tax=Plebeiibacterium sediminum TaxID=2992112 RepID=A0AAE3M5H0_9BACT|nr:DUF4249 domain-containing protein [Plebeiobacterium sediminum]MCW3787311.1 DUF4249 domain-containing protein [Plebeiobacterium sediminum]
MKRYIKFLATSALFILLYSCTETIDIDFNDFDNQYVIEGNVSTDEAPLISITSTINFDEPNEFPGVPGARVTLTDDLGNIDVLDEISTGLFSKDGFIGQEGRTYSLSVELNNELFSSVCKIPNQVMLDSISIEKEEASIWSDVDADSIYNVFVYFQDPIEVDNYYFFVEYVNGEQVRSFPMSDEYSDGEYLDWELHTHDRELNVGDVVTVEMRCISEDVFEYLRDLDQDNGMSATPTNPITNIQNATLGYFSAHTSQRLELIIEE